MRKNSHYTFFSSLLMILTCPINASNIDVQQAKEVTIATMFNLLEQQPQEALAKYQPFTEEEWKCAITSDKLFKRLIDSQEKPCFSPEKVQCHFNDYWFDKYEKTRWLTQRQAIFYYLINQHQARYTLINLLKKEKEVKKKLFMKALKTEATFLVETTYQEQTFFYLLIAMLLEGAPTDMRDWVIEEVFTLFAIILNDYQPDNSLYINLLQKIDNTIQGIVDLDIESYIHILKTIKPKLKFLINQHDELIQALSKSTMGLINHSKCNKLGILDFYKLDDVNDILYITRKLFYVINANSPKLQGIGDANQQVNQRQAFIKTLYKLLTIICNHFKIAPNKKNITQRIKVLQSEINNSIVNSLGLEKGVRFLLTTICNMYSDLVQKKSYKAVETIKQYQLHHNDLIKLCKLLELQNTSYEKLDTQLMNLQKASIEFQNSHTTYTQLQKQLAIYDQDLLLTKEKIAYYFYAPFTFKAGRAHYLFLTTKIRAKHSRESHVTISYLRNIMLQGTQTVNNELLQHITKMILSYSCYTSPHSCLCSGYDHSNLKNIEIWEQLNILPKKRILNKIINMSADMEQRFTYYHKEGYTQTSKEKSLAEYPLLNATPQKSYNAFTISIQQMINDNINKKNFEAQLISSIIITTVEPSEVPLQLKKLDYFTKQLYVGPFVTSCIIAPYIISDYKSLYLKKIKAFQPYKKRYLTACSKAIRNYVANKDLTSEKVYIRCGLPFLLIKTHKIRFEYKVMDNLFIYLLLNDSKAFKLLFKRFMQDKSLLQTSILLGNTIMQGSRFVNFSSLLKPVPDYGFYENTHVTNLIQAITQHLEKNQQVKFAQWLLHYYKDAFEEVAIVQLESIIEAYSISGLENMQPQNNIASSPSVSSHNNEQKNDYVLVTSPVTLYNNNRDDIAASPLILQEHYQRNDIRFSSFNLYNYDKNSMVFISPASLPNNDHRNHIEITPINLQNNDATNTLLTSPANLPNNDSKNDTLLTSHVSPQNNHAANTLLTSPANLPNNDSKNDTLLTSHISLQNNHATNTLLTSPANLPNNDSKNDTLLTSHVSLQNNHATNTLLTSPESLPSNNNKTDRLLSPYVSPQNNYQTNTFLTSPETSPNNDYRDDIEITPINLQNNDETDRLFTSPASLSSSNKEKDIPFSPLVKLPMSNNRDSFNHVLPTNSNDPNNNRDRFATSLGLQNDLLHSMTTEKIVIIVLALGANIGLILHRLRAIQRAIKKKKAMEKQEMSAETIS